MNKKEVFMTGLYVCKSIILVGSILYIYDNLNNTLNNNSKESLLKASSGAQSKGLKRGETIEVFFADRLLMFLNKRVRYVAAYRVKEITIEGDYIMEFAGTRTATKKEKLEYRRLILES